MILPSNKMLYILLYVSIAVYILLTNLTFEMARDVWQTKTDTVGMELLQSVNGPTLSDDRHTPVLIVTYQRSGSTFLGELLNRHKEAFYWFEPMDAVYHQMFGVTPGYVVPSDVMSWPNGSERIIPEREQEHLTQATVNILSCRMEKLPTELLAGPFLFTFDRNQVSMKRYRRCVEKTIPHFHQRSCRFFIKTVCPDRFGSNWTQMRQCHGDLDPDTNLDDNMFYIVDEDLYKEDPYYARLEDPIFNAYDSQGRFRIGYLQRERKIKELIEEFRNEKANTNKTYDELMGLYKTCMNNRRRLLLPKCIPELKDTCNSSKIRGLKTIRMTLENALEVKKYIPDLRIIYNIRSPLAIAVSRNKTAAGESYMSIYSNGTIYQKEVELICRIMEKDLEVYRGILGGPLQKSVYLNKYEQYAAAPLNTLDAIYAFLDLHKDFEVVSWLARNARRSSGRAMGWRSGLNLDAYALYRQQCSVLFEKFGDILPDELAWSHSVNLVAKPPRPRWSPWRYTRKP